VLGTRLIGTLLLAVATAALALAGCARVAPSTAGCVGAPDTVMTELTDHLSVAGTLRNGEMVPAASPGLSYYISAELVVAAATQRTRGPILTWFGRPMAGAPLTSADPNARRYSRWATATRGVSDGGPAMRSRGCTYRLLGTNPNNRCVGLSGGLASLCQKANKVTGS